jgi:hypothetical protein
LQGYAQPDVALLLSLGVPTIPPELASEIRSFLLRWSTPEKFYRSMLDSMGIDNDLLTPTSKVVLHAAALFKAGS